MQKSFKIITGLIFFSFLLVSNMHAQMFSVDNELRKQTNPLASYIRIGVQPMDFNYTGAQSALISPDIADLSYSGLVTQIGFEASGFNLDLLFGDNFTGLENRRVFGLSLKFTNPFYLIRRDHFGLGIPIQLGTELLNVRSDQVNTEFAQTNLYAGGGLTAILFYPEKFSISTNIIPSFGFSTASGGFIGGDVFSLNSKIRFNFFNLIFGRNISLGYDYIYDSYDIDGEEFDYDLNGHSITIGISL
jgi:hypothetical protein